MLFSLPENSKPDFGGVEQKTNRPILCISDKGGLILNRS